jgi:hypothetical protein
MFSFNAFSDIAMRLKGLRAPRKIKVGIAHSTAAFGLLIRNE